MDINEERSREETDQVYKIREETFEVDNVERPSEAEKSNFILEQKNKRTLLKTSSNVKRFNLFLENIGDAREIQEINPQELNELLEDFFMTVKKQDLSEYEPSSLRGMFASFNRYLQEKKYSESLLSSTTFNEQEKCSIPNSR